MKLFNLGLGLVLSLSISTQANAVSLWVTTNKPLEKTIFLKKHKDRHGHTIIDGSETRDLDGTTLIPINLDGNDEAGIEIISADGKPIHHNCEILINPAQISGGIALDSNNNTIICHPYGGLPH